MSTYSFTGLDELRSKLATLTTEAPELLKQAGLKSMQLNVEAAAKENTREHNDNGILTASINTQASIESGQQVIKTGSSEIHGIYLEYGTGLYATGPGGSQAKKIPWLWKVESRKWAAIFGIERGESVVWYGSKPHPWLRPAWDENKDQVVEDVKRELQDAFRRFA